MAAKEKPASSGKSGGLRETDRAGRQIGTEDSASPPAPQRRCVLGIDPGASGGVAFFLPDRPDLIGVHDMPAVAGDVDAAELARLVAEMAPDFAVIEAVHAMPKQGVSSSFRFGRAYGTALGVLAALRVPTHLVTPQRWKKHFGLSAEKERSRALAIRLWPASRHFARKKDTDRAEAALIARYGAEVLR